MTNEPNDARVSEILAAVEPLAAEYYRLTGKPLGVTGEVAEYVAARELGLTLVAARMAGYDALRGPERTQIKGRAYSEDAKPGQRMSRIRLGAPCDNVLLRADVCQHLVRSGAKARDRGAARSGIRELRAPDLAGLEVANIREAHGSPAAHKACKGSWSRKASMHRGLGDPLEFLIVMDVIKARSDYRAVGSRVKNRSGHRTVRSGARLATRSIRPGLDNAISVLCLVAGSNFVWFS